MTYRKCRLPPTILLAPSYNQDHEALFKAGFATCQQHFRRDKSFINLVLSCDAPPLSWIDTVSAGLWPMLTALMTGLPMCLASSEHGNPGFFSPPSPLEPMGGDDPGVDHDGDPAMGHAPRCGVVIRIVSRMFGILEMTPMLPLIAHPPLVAGGLLEINRERPNEV